MSISLNIWAIGLLLAAGHGIFLSLFLFIQRHKGNRLANQLLAIFLIIFSLNIINAELVRAYSNSLPHLIAVTYTFVFLLGPLLYFYADSLTSTTEVFDKRKWLHFIPFLAGNLYLMPFYVQISGSYIQFDDRRDGLLYTPDMSRRGRAVDLWAALKFLGRKGIEEIVDHLCDRAVQFGKQLASNGFRILNDIVFNQVLVACNTPEETKATLKNIQSSGEFWCGEAEWKNEPVIRISVCSWATTPEDINRSVKAFVDARDLTKK